MFYSLFFLYSTHTPPKMPLSLPSVFYLKKEKKKNIVCAFLFWGSLFHFFSKQVFLFCFSFLAASKSLIREMFILKMLNMRSLLSFLFLFKFKINRNEITIGFCSTGNRTWSTSCGFTVVVVVNKRRASFPFFFFFSNFLVGHFNDSPFPFLELTSLIEKEKKRKSQENKDKRTVKMRVIVWRWGTCK